MKTMKISFLMMALTGVLLTSCKNTSGKKQVEVTTVEQAPAKTVPMEQQIFPITFDGLISSYLVIKDALVADNSTVAASEAEQFSSILEQLAGSELEEAVQKFIATTSTSMQEHIAQIGKGDLAEQREHLELLTDDMIAMVAVTGSSQTLYQQFCPMYKGNEGGIWLSANKEIRNPLFGSKMLKCGVVQNEIN